MNRILILDRPAIERKLKRMAWEVCEHASGADGITLIGIEGGGSAVAEELASLLKNISGMPVQLCGIRLDKKSPLNPAPVLTAPIAHKIVILADDVAASGSTLLHALRPVLESKPSAIKIAVLVDRQHKAFPLTPDIVGHTLATTLQENIFVEVEGGLATAAYLQ